MTLRSKILIALGFVFLGVGAVGIFLPILPTTPFVLLAAGCFSGSDKLNTWLNRAPLFRDYIKNYKERTGLKKSTVIISLSFLWAMITVSALCIRETWAYMLMPAIGVLVSAHVLHMSLPRKKK